MEKEEFKSYLERQGAHLPKESIDLYYDLVFNRMWLDKEFTFSADDFTLADHLTQWNFLGSKVSPKINNGSFIGKEIKHFRVI